jgi:hypothetical protein
MKKTFFFNKFFISNVKQSFSLYMDALNSYIYYRSKRIYFYDEISYYKYKDKQLPYIY